MSGDFGQAAAIAKDPYAWLSEHEIETEPGDYPDFINPLEVVVKALDRMVIPAGKKVKRPVEPTGRKSWQGGYDPESRVIPETLVPGILEGNPQQRTDQPTPFGKPTVGEATFINFICDCSGSMRTSDMGILPGFTECKRWEMVKVILTSLIKTAKQDGHFFQVVGYDEASWEIWPGPSNEYDAARAFFMNPPADGPQPFAPGGNTHPGQAMRYAYNKMEKFIVAGKYKVKSCVTFIIADEAIHIGTRQDGDHHKFVGYWDEKFREYGPVYYCLTVPIDPDGNIAPKGATMARKMPKIRRDLAAYYGNRYETEDCVTSFGLFWNPETDTTMGGGNLIRICQGRSNNRCTGKTSK
jgi:hypothetical protein